MLAYGDQDIWFLSDTWILVTGQQTSLGGKFGYALLTVILLSNLMAILLQSLCAFGCCYWARAADVSGLFQSTVNFCLWVLCEIAIAACDLGTPRRTIAPTPVWYSLGLGLHPHWDVLVLLFLQSKGFRYVEVLGDSVVATVGICFSRILSPNLI